MRGSNGTSLPLMASVDIAPATSAAASTFSVRNTAARASAVETWVPFRSASPSFGARRNGSSPARRSASVALRQSFPIRASPSPMSTPARCASGARSPDAPTEP